MVLTESSTKFEIIRKISENKQECIISELDKIECRMGSKNFREIFKTITCDNGSENLDFQGMEQSAVTNGKRVAVYYAHPYSAWERGTNECANKLIRRFIKKGEDISKYTKKFIKYIQDWMNNYPRKKYDWLSSKELTNLLNLPCILW